MAAPRTASSSLLSLLIAAAAAAAAAAAVLPLYAPPPAAAQQLPGNILVKGTVPCSAEPTTPATPVFSNASVLLQCGTQVISRTTSNINGTFALLISSDRDPVTVLLQLLNRCKLVIPTPLSACNQSLPTTGTLQSPLQLLSGTGLLGGIFNIVPVMFNFTNP